MWVCCGEMWCRHERGGLGRVDRHAGGAMSGCACRLDGVWRKVHGSTSGGWYESGADYGLQTLDIC